MALLTQPQCQCVCVASVVATIEGGSGGINGSYLMGIRENNLAGSPDPPFAEFSIGTCTGGIIDKYCIYENFTDVDCLLPNSVFHFAVLRKTTGETFARFIIGEEGFFSDDPRVWWEKATLTFCVFPQVFTNSDRKTSSPCVSGSDCSSSSITITITEP